MKRIILTMCALVMLLTGCVPVYAASTDRAYYPIEVEETTEGSVQDYRIKKTYQLALTDDPVNIPTDDFMRNGLTYHLLDMTRKDDIGVDTQPYTETVTKPSDTDKMESILQNLDAELEVTTEEGYSGTLRLDHTSVQVTVDGYGTKTRSLSATRTYPNLSDADADAGRRPVGGIVADRSRRRGAALQRHRQLYRQREQPLRHRLYRDRELLGRGGENRLRRRDLYRHLRRR